MKEFTKQIGIELPEWSLMVIVVLILDLLAFGPWLSYVLDNAMAISPTYSMLFLPLKVIVSLPLTTMTAIALIINRITNKI